MSKTDIVNYLKERHPDYVSIEDLECHLRIQRTNIYRALRSLHDHDEILWQIIWDDQTGKQGRKTKTVYCLNINGG